MNEIAFALLVIVSMCTALIAYKLGKVWLCSFIALCLILANITGPKVIEVFGFAITAGTPIFAALVFGTDMLAERYGKKAAQQAVFIGFMGMAFFIVLSQIVLMMTPLPFAEVQGTAIDTIYSSSLRMMIASPVAYLIWQSFDVWLYDKIHQKTGEKMLWLRNNASTFTTMAGSTLTFFFLAFYGVNDAWLEIAIVTIVFYWLIASLDTVFIYLSKIIKPLDIKET